MSRYAPLNEIAMTTELDRDLKKPDGLAFYRAEWAEDVLRRYHAAIPELDAVVAQQLQVLYNWIAVQAIPKANATPRRVTRSKFKRQRPVIRPSHILT
jgi:hypothetical protein